MSGPGPTLDLGVIGNANVAALVDNGGRIVWFCLPRPDGDPVFSALLTPEGGDSPRGVFAIDLQDQVARAQRYLRNTAILETVLRDAQGGELRITDFCPRFRTRGRMFRPTMIVRIVEPLAGRPLVKVRLHATSGFGAVSVVPRRGSHHLGYAADAAGFRVTTDASLSLVLEQRAFVLGAPMVFILGPDETVDEAPAALARSFLEQTREYWQDWVRTLAVPAEFQEAVIRAAITLKLCTYEDTGAVLAALTTSIPESPDSGRTWDYRFCWLRDSYFVVQTLNRLGVTRTMEAYLHFIDQVIADSASAPLQPLYGLGGRSDSTEYQVASLAGYRGMGPVRVGNAAATQRQHDVYGSVILAATQLFFDERLIHRGDRALFGRLEQLGHRAVATFDLPDAGPWEFRGEQRTHTLSALMSWAGCDRLARIAQRLGETGRAAYWQATASTLRERLLSLAWSDRRQAFVGAFGGEHLDASVLLLPELGLLPATDPRFVATVDAIGRELATGELLYRYRHADDFGLPESTFTICGFWYVNALAGVGRIEEARERFGKLLARRSPLGLLSEDVHPVSGELWGNFPQTYSMVGIIASALRLSRHWEEVA